MAALSHWMASRNLPRRQEVSTHFDTKGQPVFSLCEWYRRRKEADPVRTHDTYLDMALPWAGFLLRNGHAWNDPPDRVQFYLAEFLREDVACLVTPDGRGEDGWYIETTGNSPLKKSSLGVLLAALTSLYDTLILASYRIFFMHPWSFMPGMHKNVQGFPLFRTTKRRGL